MIKCLICVEAPYNPKLLYVIKFFIEIKLDTLITHLKDGYIVKDKIVKLSKDSLVLYNYNFKELTRLYNRGKY